MAKKKKVAKKGLTKPVVETAALEVNKGDHTVVGIFNLHVTIIQDGKFWFAQGLEIDYATQGSSLDDVKKQFEDGLQATIQEHLKIHGTIENILQVAPPKIWRDAMQPSARGEKLTHFSSHDGPAIQDFLPSFEKIQYLQVAA